MQDPLSSVLNHRNRLNQIILTVWPPITAVLSVVAERWKKKMSVLAIADKNYGKKLLAGKPGLAVLSSFIVCPIDLLLHLG